MLASCCMTIQHPTSWCLTSNLPKNQRSQQRIDLQSTATSSKWPQAHDWLWLSVTQQRLADQKIIGAKSGAGRHLTIWYHLQVGDVFLSNIYWELLKNDAFPRMRFFLTEANYFGGSYHFRKQSRDGCLQASEDVFPSKPSSELQMKCQLCVALVMLWCMKWHEKFAPCIRWVWQCKADHGAQLAFGCNGRESQRSVCKCWLVFIMLQQSRTWEDSSSLWEHWVQDSNPFCQPFVKLR